MENNISKKIYDDAITEFIGLCNIPHVSNAVEKPNYKDHLVPYRDYLTDQIKTYCKEIKIYHDDVGNI
ncbi:MAG: hypothetical protein MJ219_00990 [Mycoplasmoidaceae bacterium]|nr:hypothetical protein [Mycoplasmoidaceae bacterium]